MTCRTCRRQYHVCPNCDVTEKERGAMEMGFCSIACAKVAARNGREWRLGR